MCKTTFKQRLLDICSFYGIELVGIAPARVYSELIPVLESRKISENNLDNIYDIKDINKRTNPFLTMKNCKSIIVCLFPYYTGYNNDSQISVYTYALDYHIIVRSYLKKIAASLNKEIDNFEYKTFVDTGPLLERHLAYMAGLGFIGKNGMLITSKYGTYVFIGYILNNYPFEPDSPLNLSCQNCGECIKHCPGNAISEDSFVDTEKCVSYITQKKGNLSKKERYLIKKQNTIFGCDICQKVCPHNYMPAETSIKEFRENHLYSLDYKKLQALSERQFRRIYGNRAFSWRGKKVLLRNIRCIDQS
jgi:epoxyqueuosine reductase